MKRRYLSLIFALLLILCTAGCAKKSSVAATEATTTAKAIAETTVKETKTEAETKATVDETTIIETTTIEETTIIETTVKETTAEETIIEDTTIQETEPENLVTEDGEYSSKEEVALYIHLYGHLPSNYISKEEAEKLGWVASKGNLWKVAPGKSIGGSKFGNYEKLLPTAKGRKYTECDIDYDGGKRNAKRIVFSNDGLVYYTEDHYETFEQLY